MRGHRYRNMYYLTGLPGWMRFGFSPGWGTLPPGAQYFMSGNFPTWQTNYAFKNISVSNVSPPSGVFQLDRQQELKILKMEAQNLKTQLEQIEKRIKELES